MNYTINPAASQQGHQGSALHRVLNAFEGIGKVKKTGRDTYVAFNPLIQNQRTGSVSIRADGSRVLIHDFAGHGTVEILQALNLGLADLWETPLTHHAPKSKAQMSAASLVHLLRGDLLLVLCAMRMVINAEPINESDIEHLNSAASRIRDALALGGHHR